MGRLVSPSASPGLLLGRPLDRRALLRLVGRGAAGAAALSLLGCGGDDGGVTLDAATADATGCRATTADVLGPFHREGAPSRMTIASATEPGTRLGLDGVVLADDCSTPLVGAVLDVWQCDAAGAYHEPAADPADPYRLRGVLGAAGDGSWALETIRPGNYRNGPGWRPAHLHFRVSHPGYRMLTTQLYFAGDPYLPPNDSCTTCGSDDPARIIPLTSRAGGGLAGTFAIVLARA